MKKFTILILVVFICNPLLAEQIVEIKFESLPDAVKKTSLFYIGKQNISKILKIDDGALVKFEVKADKIENNKNIRAQDIIIASTGKVIKFTQEVPYFSLSFEQMQEIEKHFPNIKVNELESVEIHYYDVLGEVNGQKVKLRLFENGAIEQNKIDQ